MFVAKRIKHICVCIYIQLKVLITDGVEVERERGEEWSVYIEERE